MVGSDVDLLVELEPQVANRSRSSELATPLFRGIASAVSVETGVPVEDLEPAEFLGGSDSISAALVDAVYPVPLDRRFQGTSDLRCKIQLAGTSQYRFDDICMESSSQRKLLFAYRPVGTSKLEHIDAGTHERSMTLVFPVLEDSLAGCDRNDAGVEKALRLMGGNSLLRQCAMSMDVERLAASLLSADKRARSFEKLRRSRLDELACLVLDLFLDTLLDQQTLRLTARERRQVLDARDLLISDLCSAPSLNKLAASVGTNRTKLNKGFREIFGMSPYQLLHLERMRVARKLLESDQLTVTDIATRCGYDHVSNFSLAFKAFHGFAPSALRGPASAEQDA